MQPKKFKSVRRFHELGDAHAINFSCFHNQRFLSSDRARKWFVDSLQSALDSHQSALWAFCLMPDHVHLLVYPKTPTFDGSTFLLDLKTPVTDHAVAWVSTHAPHFLVRMEDRQPSGKGYRRFWQRGGGYDRNLRTLELIYAEIDYIHNNPVKAALAERAIDRHWSSARQWHGLDGGLALCDWTDLPPRLLQRH